MNQLKPKFLGNFNNQVKVKLRNTDRPDTKKFNMIHKYTTADKADNVIKQKALQCSILKCPYI